MGRRSDHSREEISSMALEAARVLVADEGLKGLTARKVATEIGYAPGTLYVVFRNLDDLVLHLNAGTLDDLYSVLDAVVRSCRKPERCILKLAMAYVEFSFTHPNLWGAIYEHRLPEGESAPAWFQEKIERLFSLVEGQLGGLDERRSDKEVRLAAHALWSGIHGVCILGLSGSLEKANAGSTAAIAESLVVNYLAGYTQ
ncbi:MAG: TetR/AcrR family transcriptional regulator [Candidatus Sedimenticola sp. PURPLELP]